MKFKEFLNETNISNQEIIKEIINGGISISSNDSTKKGIKSSIKNFILNDIEKSVPNSIRSFDSYSDFNKTSPEGIKKKHNELGGYKFSTWIKETDLKFLKFNRYVKRYLEPIIHGIDSQNLSNIITILMLQLKKNLILILLDWIDLNII